MSLTGASRQLIFLGFLILLIFVSTASSTVIEGIVLSEKGPVEDATAYAYVDFQDIKDKSPSYVSVPGDKKGFYKLELPPGKYYLTASGTNNGNEYYSYHGANPITVEDRNLWIPFMALPKTSGFIRDSASTKLSGKITFKGSPVENAQVSIFSPAASTFRGMGFLTDTTDGHGVFRINPEPGEYVIVARKRKGFKGIRPLRKGDLFCYFSGNPVNVRPSEETVVEIPCYPKDDIKAFLDEEIYPSILIKKSGKDSIRFRENKLEKPASNFNIKGRVTDLQGNPKKGLYVMAYKGKSSHMFKMLYVRTMPDYLVMTDEKGHYTINAAEKGTYYMVARERIGEAPAKGEYYGLYEDNANHSVVPAEDPVNSIDIVVSRVMAEKNQNSKLPVRVDSGKTRNNTVQNHIYSEDTIINENTEWSGYIIISGTVHVARGAVLTVKPGTVVMFKKIDRNRDGVGDGKIKVSGRLIARGAADNMIRFTSAEENPHKMDWSYLLFFVSGDDNIINYCAFEYAFTGVQVHFSKAFISDSVFTKNHEGVRFGRTELLIEHNNILDNTYGIRYTRLEGPVKIMYNNIRNNNVGIFHVPSNQNIVDFSETFSEKKIFHPHQPVVRYNNIAYNEEYNFRLGERQGYNMLLKDNWWGSINDKDILNAIYDEKDDSALGSVVYKPYLTMPVKYAGARGN